MEGAGHLARTSGGKAVKKVFLGERDGRRKAGRPKLRGLDCTENDLISIDVKRWGKKAEDRQTDPYGLQF
jgi:hypothetical protein